MKGRIGETKRAEVAELIGQGRGVVEVAERTGIDRHTISRWIDSDVDFQEKIEKTQRAITRHLRRQMVGLIDAAVATFSRGLNGGQVTPSQARLAQSVLGAFGVLKHTATADDRSNREVIEVAFGAVPNTPLDLPHEVKKPDALPGNEVASA